MRPILPEAWSFSSLNQYLRICGAQFLFQRVQGLDPESESPNLVLGSAVHHAHAFVRSRQKAGKPTVLDDARQVFVESFEAMASNPIVAFQEGEAESLREEGLKYVDLIATNLGKEEVVAVEQDFEVPLVDSTGEVLERPLRGSFDLVLRAADGSLVVEDLKTAAVRYSADKLANDLQATTYCYAASRLWPGGARFRFAVVLKHRKPTFERIEVVRHQAAFDRLIALVRMAEKGIDAGVFVPNDGCWACNGCGYRSACAKWAAEPASLMVPENGNGVKARVPA